MTHIIVSFELRIATDFHALSRKNGCMFQQTFYIAYYISTAKIEKLLASGNKDVVCLDSRQLQ